MNQLSHREKSILVGLFLSKFDKKGLQYLGFISFSEAFNVIGLSLKVKPASIKNYRDEFDPIFPNKRQGWHKRKIRQYCKDIYNTFQHLNIEDFSNFLKKIIYENYELDILTEQVIKKKDRSSSFAKRLITGQAAEQYFKENYNKIDVFKKYQIEDTTKYGCGFDFKLFSKDKDFLGVEVKGLNNNGGNINLTNKEYLTAKLLGERYYIFVVKNFKKKPIHIYFKNPLDSELILKKTEILIRQVSWNAFIK